MVKIDLNSHKYGIKNCKFTLNVEILRSIVVKLVQNTKFLMSLKVS